MVGHINIFGTNFCIPKGYTVGKGFQVIECKPPLRKEDTEQIKKEVEIIRNDILELFHEHNDRFPSEEELKIWLKKKELKNAKYQFSPESRFM